MNYSKYNVPLTKNQAKSLAVALEKMMPVNIRLSEAQLKKKKGAMVPLLLDPLQLNRMKYSIKKGKGALLKFTKEQIEKMKTEGGIAPALAALIPVGIALLSGIAGYTGSEIAKEVDKKIIRPDKGKGLYPVGHRGGCMGFTKCHKCGYIPECPKCGFSQNDDESSDVDGEGLYPIGYKNKRGSGLFPHGVKRK